jgi:hypothetical protein
MWDKIKSFLTQKWVIILAWVLWIVATAVLILQGFTTVDIGTALKYVVAIIEAVGVLIAFIKAILIKKNTTSK